MKAHMFICFVSLVLLDGFCVSGRRPRSENTTPYASHKYRNPVHAEFDQPSKDAVADLNELKDLNVLQFYNALEELYLTGGFEKTQAINKIILAQKLIPDDIYGKLITTLKLTRRELKNGDSTLFELNSQLNNTDSNITRELLTAARNAIRNATKTNGDQDAFIQEISRLRSSNENYLDEFNTNKSNGAEEFDKLLENLKKEINSDDFSKISKAVKTAFSSGIGGVNGVKNALIAGARLFYNLGGSVDMVNTKCSQLMDAFRRDQSYSRKLSSAGQIVHRLNRSDSDGDFGYHLLFKVFFDEPSPQGNMIFLPAKLMRHQTMLSLFENLQNAENETIYEIMKSISNSRYRIDGYRLILDSLQDDEKIISVMEHQFGVKIKDLEAAKHYRNILEKLGEISVDIAYLLRYVRSVITIYETGNYNSFMKSLVGFTQLSRDNKFRDVWNALDQATKIVNVRKEDDIPYILGPLRDLRHTVNGSYAEVFQALKMIIADEQDHKIKAKCQFIGDLFTGLSDAAGVLKSLGIPVADMQRWMDSTDYIDALVSVLKAAESYANLNRLLDFHGKHTTVEKKPLESMDLIDNFIVYLEQNVRWNRKNPLLRTLTRSSFW